MSTYLLTWSPSRYDWQRLPYLVHLSAQGWPALHDWTCQNTKRIRDGDRCFMLRQGPEPNGIMGSGYIISPKPYPGKRLRKGRGVRPPLFVDIHFDTLLDPDFDPILPRARLYRGKLTSVHWDTAHSGIQIPEDAAGELEALWQEHLARIQWRERNNLA